MKAQSRLGITIVAKNLAELTHKIKKAGQYADMIEIRLDKMPKLDFADIRKITKKPLIVVAKKGATFVEIMEKGADYIDIDIQTEPQFLKQWLAAKNQSIIPKNSPTKTQTKFPKIIISYHNFHKTPQLPELWKIFQKAQKSGADIIKIATTAQNIEDNLTIFNLLAKAQKNKTPCIAVCMGEQGRISRLLGPIFGSYLSYIALDQQSKTAKGMLTVEEWKKVERKLKTLRKKE